MNTETESVDLVGEQTVENVARAAVFAALTGAFAFVAFPNPVSPTAITLQVLGVFLAGAYLGPLWGGVSLTLYLAAGGMGAPVFSGGTAGVGVLTGSTGGYLLSYPFAAALVGGIVHGTDGIADPRDVSVPRLVLGMAAGTVVIYAMGTVGFAYVQNVSLYEAFVVSAVAFVPAEAIKIAAAVGVTRSDELNAA